jgi:hypothetical protein
MTPLKPDEDRDTLYVTDAEIARRWGVGPKAARIAIETFERNPRFPKRDPLFSGKRYWPKVKAFTDWRAGLTMDAPETEDGEERYETPETKDQRRTRSTLATAR